MPVFTTLCHAFSHCHISEKLVQNTYIIIYNLCVFLKTLFCELPPKLVKEQNLQTTHKDIKHMHDFL